MNHSHESSQRLGPPAAVELGVDVQAEDVVDLVLKPLLDQLLDELHPTSGDLLPAVRTGH